ncbi:MAG: Rieske 2Fe-2S domain-containing protein [Candidatus Sericytochromatia bacterium]
MKSRYAPKDGASRAENLRSQPPVEQRVFNNQRVLPKGWYPVCAARALRPGTCRSFKIFRQRIVVYRTESGAVHALDAFCPHLGADLGNGRVVGERIQCYFHQWEYAGDGALARIPCRKLLDQGLEGVRARAYPVTEAYGHLWVFSAPEASHALPKPPTLEDQELSALFIKEITLFAHHHVMMANGVDLQHFASVHKLDIDFDYQIQADESGVFDWTLKGEIPTNTLKGRLARWLLGPTFEYHARFAGGSIVTLTYGSNQRFKGLKLPSLQMLWGCLPMENGISKARIFLVTKKRHGLTGRLTNGLMYFLTVLLLTMLRDEDIEAFPHMRFNTHRLIKEDASLARLIQLMNKLELSDWGDSGG